eukprot:CAMPEP_0184007884 /NCGR_PEP_ID=MMETSP0954-20121128/1622_1 /TAXON_ID=627963 /ORGANISM="Aplanochytrium sp, Strain PBS07" /LENGTH=220 /DNA_ID=CAMNT_0026286845 /DNA_START=251 /DNA_END=913 /DNA_ORIENTATION=-
MDKTVLRDSVQSGYKELTGTKPVQLTRRYAEDVKDIIRRVEDLSCDQIIEDSAWPKSFELDDGFNYGAGIHSEEALSDEDYAVESRISKYANLGRMSVDATNSLGTFESNRGANSAYQISTKEDSGFSPIPKSREKKAASEIFEETMLLQERADRVLAKYSNSTKCPNKHVRENLRNLSDMSQEALRHAGALDEQSTSYLPGQVESLRGLSLLLGSTGAD